MFFRTKFSLVSNLVVSHRSDPRATGLTLTIRQDFKFFFHPALESSYLRKLPAISLGLVINLASHPRTLPWRLVGSSKLSMGSHSLCPRRNCVHHMHSNGT